MAQVTNKIINKLRAMLAKADVARNDNAHEREIAMRQATALMDEYNLSIADINDDSGQQDDLGDLDEVRMHIGAKQWRANITGHVCRLYGCATFRLKAGRNTHMVITGRLAMRETVLTVCELVFASIEREYAASRFAGGGRGTKNQFCMGASEGVWVQVSGLLLDRQEGNTLDPVPNHTNGLILLQQYDRLESEADALQRERYHIKRGRSASRLYRTSAYERGVTVGRSVSLNTAVTGGEGSRHKLPRGR